MVHNEMNFPGLSSSRTVFPPGECGRKFGQSEVSKFKFRWLPERVEQNRITWPAPRMGPKHLRIYRHLKGKATRLEDIAYRLFENV